jgi:opacity protein-like surface antigen
MKKISIILLTIVFLFLSTAVTLADAEWQFSIEDLTLSGNLDNFLYWGNTDSSQVISKVSMPQNQNMIVLSGTYNLPNNGFIKLQYGDTGAAMKGRGSDSDWTNYGSDTITYYGDMDCYGNQKIYDIDFGTILKKNDIQEITMFLGWGKQESTNEFKNIIYHLVNGGDVGNATQPDNGTSLNAYFSGIRFGASDDILINSKFGLDFSFIYSFLNAEVDGHWANYTPAHDWVSSGSGYGYTADIGFKYLFNDHLTARLGYRYNYVEVDNCNDILNGVYYNQVEDYKYNLSGLNFGIIYQF